MRVTRFAIFTAVVWGLATLLITAISAVNGDSRALVELDFRPLTATVMLIAEGLELKSYVMTLADYAETGMPVTPVNVILAFVLALIDGFASGYLIAIIYNALAPKRRRVSVTAFGVAAGVVLGLSSGLLAQVVILYDINLGSFDYSVRPLFFVFTLLTKMGLGEYASFLRDSYMTFPKTTSGVMLWAVWGFVDGYIVGAILYYIYTKVRSIFLWK